MDHVGNFRRHGHPRSPRQPPTQCRVAQGSVFGLCPGQSQRMWLGFGRAQERTGLVAGTVATTAPPYGPAHAVVPSASTAPSTTTTTAAAASSMTQSDVVNAYLVHKIYSDIYFSLQSSIVRLAFTQFRCRLYVRRMTTDP